MAESCSPARVVPPIRYGFYSRLVPPYRMRMSSLRLVIGFAESQVVQLAFVHHFTARLAVLVVLLFLRAEVVESSLAIRSK